MSTLVNNYLQHLSNIEKGECWYLVKQDTSFWKQCYFVSILESFKKQSNTLNFESFFSSKIEELNTKKNLDLPDTHRALRVAYFYGLISDPEAQYRNYSKANITDVYIEILKRTNGEFEKTELYKDIIQSQIEKIYISSIIDEKSDSIRKDFRLYPVIFLYKILLELGRSTGNFQISLDEYKFFVITQPTYENFLDCLFLIKESRNDLRILEKAKHYRGKLDSRFNLTLNELPTLEIDSKSISLNINSIQYISDLVYSYENGGFVNSAENYIHFLTSIKKNRQKKSGDLLVDTQHSISLPKPFLLLAGVSGTGKSRFVREQVPEDERKERYQLVAVRPDWHEPSDLLGYVSRLSGQAQYVMTDVLKFIVKAWKAVENAGLLRNNEVAGSKALLEQVPPYWLCLDEMNLAPVEQYFADYLAVIESRKWVWHNEDEFSYQTEALLSPTAWEDIANFQEQLDVDDELWDFFQTNGIGIPFNLIVAGTVNMDETTHAFSRKVLDRALSFDFSEFYPNDFDAFFEPKTQQKQLSYPIYSQITQNDFDELAFASKSIEFLTALNKQFENTPFKLGYRALNELLLSVKSFQPQTDEELQAVWDDFVMLKVLPRIEGDENKLYSVTQDGRSVLDDIEMVLAKHLSAIWHDNDAVRVDFWQTDVQGKPLKIKCRTKPKLANMKAQLTNRGMVSFW